MSDEFLDNLLSHDDGSSCVFPGSGRKTRLVVTHSLCGQNMNVTHEPETQEKKILEPGSSIDLTRDCDF